MFNSLLFSENNNLNCRQFLHITLRTSEDLYSTQVYGIHCITLVFTSILNLEILKLESSSQYLIVIDR